MTPPASHPCVSRSEWIVTAAHMRAIEERIFAAGFPVAALMEKVAGRITQRIQAYYPDPNTQVGVLVGPGHNGGDALVVARELHLQGYSVRLYCPFSKLKPLTEAHAQYANSLAIATSTNLAALKDCDLLIDGLFGFGLTRSLEGEIAEAIETINQWPIPVFSIDLPSGLHTDTGAVLGTAIRATRTFCLGLWKLGLFQEQALSWVGSVEWVDFDIPLADIQAVLGNAPPLRRMTSEVAIAHLPLERPVDVHKYQLGHLLLIVGSQRYAGAALLAGLGARASGVGMVTLAVPGSLKPTLTPALPEALILACPETSKGALQLPPELVHAIQNNQFQTIVAGPGLTPEVTDTVADLIASATPLLLDADALNLLARQDWLPQISLRSAMTVLTPHWGEFQRLCPSEFILGGDRITAVRHLAQDSQSIILLKGARTAIATPQGHVWINPDSTPALARGGSGDVLSGLLGGLMAQATAQHHAITPDLISAGAWWHSQAGCYAAEQRTVLGVDALSLSQAMFPALQSVFTP